MGLPAHRSRSERADTQPDSRVGRRHHDQPIVLTGDSHQLGATRAPSEDRRWDALRAVTYQQLHVAPMPEVELAEVIRSLGLDAPPPVDDLEPDWTQVPCSICHAPVDAGCTQTVDGSPFPRGHDSRRLAAMAARPDGYLLLRCPRCGAAAMQRCRTGDRQRTYKPGHRERWALAGVARNQPTNESEQ